MSAAVTRFSETARTSPSISLTASTVRKVLIPPAGLFLQLIRYRVLKMMKNMLAFQKLADREHVGSKTHSQRLMSPAPQQHWATIQVLVAVRCIYHSQSLMTCRHTVLSWS